MMKQIKGLMLGLGLLVLPVSLPASAQDAVNGVLEACEPEISTHCADVTPGDGRVLACMYAYEDKLSDQCLMSIVDLADAIDYLFASAQEAISVCAPDIEKLCSTVEFGGGRMLSCLKENEAKVSTECKPVVSAFAESYGLE